MQLEGTVVSSFLISLKSATIVWKACKLLRWEWFNISLQNDIR
jgi:hypothetical protein